DFCDRQVPTADARLYPILTTYLDRILEELPPEDHVLASARRTIAEAMRHGPPSLARVAEKMAMGARTLQRRLASYWLDLTALRRDTRRRVSPSLRADPNNRLTEVAYLVGYSEVRAFNRAFKRRTGSAPSDYRRTRPRR